MSKRGVTPEPTVSVQANISQQRFTTKDVAGFDDPERLHQVIVWLLLRPPLKGYVWLNLHIYAE
ncbi:MAG: hypothetical protein GY764_10130 [Halieaceae bacterium]|nr:hypothetical protein [Halieaceae bacterium]